MSSAVSSQIDYSAPLAPPRRAYAAQVVHDTFRPLGAKLGAIWIGLLTMCAVLAPFIASSHPILMKKAGQWSSPMMRHLRPADVILLVLAIAAGVLFLLRWRMKFRARVIALLAVLVAAVPLCSWLITPPTSSVFSSYREELASGEIERAIHTIIPFSPNDRLFEQVGKRFYLAPSPQHLLGTDQFGQDIASRMIHASRIALSVGFISTGIALVIGCMVGGVMGYFAGKVDILGMRLIEIYAAIPTIFLLLMFVALFQPNLYLMMAIIGITSWVGYARYIRAEFLKLRNQDFVQAAIAAGLPLRSILFRHMLPNAISPVLVSASFGVAGAIISEATLSFLGIGLVEDPSWGQLLSQAVSGGAFYWWIAVFPGLAIFLTVYAYNLIGESLRDAIDPRAIKRL